MGRWQFLELLDVGRCELWLYEGCLRMDYRFLLCLLQVHFQLAELVLSIRNMFAWLCLMLLVLPSFTGWIGWYGRSLLERNIFRCFSLLSRKGFYGLLWCLKFRRRCLFYYCRMFLLPLQGLFEVGFSWLGSRIIEGDVRLDDYLLESSLFWMGFMIEVGLGLFLQLLVFPVSPLQPYVSNAVLWVYLLPHRFKLQHAVIVHLRKCRVGILLFILKQLFVYVNDVLLLSFICLDVLFLVATLHCVIGKEPFVFLFVMHPHFEGIVLRTLIEPSTLV